MRWMITIAALLVLAAGANRPAAHGGPAQTQPSESKAKPLLETLLKAELDRVNGTEVILSRVTLPPHAQLPKHWHPGEEFGYVLEGSVTLWQEGKETRTLRAGDSLKIPLEQVHAASTGEEGASLIVFRVHEQGRTERVLVR